MKSPEYVIPLPLLRKLNDAFIAHAGELYHISTGVNKDNESLLYAYKMDRFFMVDTETTPALSVRVPDDMIGSKPKVFHVNNEILGIVGGENYFTLTIETLGVPTLMLKEVVYASDGIVAYESEESKDTLLITTEQHPLISMNYTDFFDHVPWEKGIEVQEEIEADYAKNMAVNTPKFYTRRGLDFVVLGGDDATINNSGKVCLNDLVTLSDERYLGYRVDYYDADDFNIIVMVVKSGKLELRKLQDGILVDPIQDALFVESDVVDLTDEFKAQNYDIVDIIPSTSFIVVK